MRRTNQHSKKMTMRSKLFKFFFDQKPYVYGLTYFLLIPIFAVFYASIPSDFYHSTAKFEHSSIEKKAKELCDELVVQIRENYKKNHREDTRDSIDDLFDIERIYLNRLIYENNNWFTDLTYRNKPKSTSNIVNQAKDYYSGGVYELSFSGIGNFMFDENGEEGMVFREIKIVDDFNALEGNLNTYHERFKRIFSSKEFSFPVLVIDVYLNNKLNEFYNTLNGQHSSFTENYWRMLYFSSVTVTTLGYGDIVPMTTKARILISIEAILGVLLIGLFLNSLSKRKTINK